MANSVDPDQTAPGSALFAHVILSKKLVYQIFGHLLYFSCVVMKIYILDVDKVLFYRTCL